MIASLYQSGSGAASSRESFVGGAMDRKEPSRVSDADSSYICSTAYFRHQECPARCRLGTTHNARYGKRVPGGSPVSVGSDFRSALVTCSLIVHQGYFC